MSEGDGFLGIAGVIITSIALTQFGMLYWIIGTIITSILIGIVLYVREKKK